MYTVYCDRLTLHDPVLNDPAYLLINPVVSQEANKAGSFTFTIAANHANANAINRLQSVIQVYDDEKLIFRGRVLNDTRTWDNSRIITCEEDLAFLNDTRVRPYTFTGTVAEYLAFLISQHNSQVPAAKQFVVGTVTVTDGSGSIRRSSTVYPTTWSELQEKLLDDYGGYLFVNWTGSVNRIDYLTDSPYVCDQQIVFGENLLDYTQENKGEDIITALIPLGKKNEDTDERLTVASVNDGKDYIVDTAAAAVYGLIFGTEEWDGVSNATTLLSKGREKLSELVQGQTSIQLTAVDLHLMDKDIESFDYLSYVTVKDEAHGIDGRMLVTKKTTNLSDPSQGKMTIGSESKGISRYHAQNTAQIAQAKATYATNQKVEDTKTALQSEIQTNADKIALVVQESSGNYVIKAAEIVASINETGSTVKIGADHIELTGEVIVNAINGGSTTINGSKITTGTLNASAIGAGTIDASVIGVTNINASNITTGALRVLDANRNVLFEADKAQNAVRIAGFTVADTAMEASHIVEDPDGDQEKRVELTIDGVKTSWTYIEGTATGTARMTASSDFAQGSLSLETELADRYEGYSSKTVINGSSFIAEDQDNLSNYIRMDVYGGQVSLEMQAFPSGGVIGDDEKTIRLSPAKTLPEISVAGSSQEALITPNKITLGNPEANGAVTIQRAAATSADPYNLKFETVSSRYMAQHGTQYSRMYDSGTSGTAPATSGSVNNTTRNPSGFWASNNTSFSAATKGSAMTREDGFVAKDGSEVVTHNSNGMAWDHGTGTTSSLRMYTLSHRSSSTEETTYAIDLPYGIYLFLHSRYTSPTAASTGMQLVTIGQTVGSSAVIKTSADSGSQIGATSGTRSQVEISNTRQGATSDSQDKLATVTWTVQGLSYRRLVMVRLM